MQRYKPRENVDSAGQSDHSDVSEGGSKKVNITAQIFIGSIRVNWT